MNNRQLSYLIKSREFYKKELLENIMPFWLEHGLDNINGGVYTCLNRDGSLMDSTKSVWFQGRFAYVCAYAYNHIEANPLWLAASKSCIDFIEKHCFDTDGHMFFSVSAEGKPIRKRRYVFSETFAAIAMAEYAKASGDPSYAAVALEIFHNIRRMLSTPGFLEPKSLIPCKGHSTTMIMVNVALVLMQVCDDPVLKEQIEESVFEIEHSFLHPEYKCILECVNPDGSLIDTCEGRTINPGHGIETAWFLINTGERLGNRAYVDLGVKVFDWQFDWGWDKEYGGIINFRDCKDLPNQDYSQDMKFWWPQCEAIIASLYAYKATGDERYLKIHKQVNEWAIKHLRDPQFGEWFGYLHRDGSVAQPAKGNLFKGPFHIPRMLVEAYLLCNQIINE
jgi:N-acylglucosamine 2-epimerase